MGHLTTPGGLIVGFGVAAVHYTGMAAMHLHPGIMAGLTGASGESFLLPLLLGITLTSFTLSLMINLSPTEAESRASADSRRRLSALAVGAAAGGPEPGRGQPGPSLRAASLAQVA